MGAELGATSSIFPFDEPMARYLRGTDRSQLADLAERHVQLLTADPEVEAEPHRFFEKVIEIDLSTLEPQIVGPHTPDLARPVSHLAAEVKEKGYPEELSAVLQFNSDLTGWYRAQILGCSDVTTDWPADHFGLLPTNDVGLSRGDVAAAIDTCNRFQPTANLPGRGEACF